MKFEILLSDRFKRNYNKLNDNEKAQLRKKLSLFVQDPFYPSLRTKHIKGTDNLFEFSVNMDVRVIWSYQEGKIIILLDIGHHNMLNRY